ncbi:MAG: right-handed parallel beta-helix repeat-containing protein, partial [Dokdonella sp.]
NDLLIADNRFFRNGRGSVFDHNIYLDESGGATTGGRILRNELYRSSARDTGICGGTSLVVHGEHTDLLIEDNLIYEDIGAANQGCWGIGVNAGYAETEGFVRVIIRGNTIRNVGNTAIGISSCVDCIVENNVIEHQQAFDMFGIFAPTGGAGGNDLPMDHLTVRNNSIYTSNGDSIGIYVGGQGTGHVIVSNAIQANISGGSWACLSMPLPGGAYAAINNNVCGYAPASGREWEEGSGNIAAWRAASGFDLASKAMAPGFASPGAPGHNLSAASATSAMVDAGHASLSAQRDVYGILRSPPPDAGAHEFGFSDTIFVNGFEQ